MAKKTLSSCFFVAFLSALLQASPIPALPFFENSLFNVPVEECDAPAPANFRVTASSSNSISLSWAPAWEGALHSLLVFEEAALNEWELLNIFQDVPENVYTVSSLESGKKYRFSIATKCVSGEVGQETTFTDGITLIVDLVIGGRVPVNPNAVDCENIPLDYPWKGFKMEYIDGEGLLVVNYFEILVGETLNNGNVETRISVNRPYVEPHLVAATLSGFWPDCEDPILADVGNSFKIFNLVENVDVGVISCGKITPNSVSLCPEWNYPGIPWNASYQMTALVSERYTFGEDCEEGGEFRNKPIVIEKIKIQNPIHESMTIYFDNLPLTSSKVNFKLFNANGGLVGNYHIVPPARSVTLPTIDLPEGFYSLLINGDNWSQCAKIIKIPITPFPK